MTDVISSIAKLSQKHILKDANEAYVKGFAVAATNVYPPKQLSKILQEKFFIPNDSGFDLNKYLESAAELSVQNYLKQEPRIINIALDKRVNPPKNVDAYYEVGPTHISLEVKCAEEVELSSDSFTVVMAGRVPNHLDKFNALKSAMPKETVQLVKNKDNTLKDFLISANNKFSPDSGVDDLNILFIACGDAVHIQDWYNYLYATSGFFTADPLCSYLEYNLVDVVILSNLKYYHTLAKQFHDWTLRDVFLLPCVNPHHRTTAMSGSIVSGLSVFNHHLKLFNDFSPTPFAAQALKVIHYVVEKLQPRERDRYFPVRKK